MTQRSPVTNLFEGLALTTIGAMAAWISYSRLGIDHALPIPPAIDSERVHFDGRTSRNIHYYVDHADSAAAEQSQPPIVLIHSINAAASAYEMKPLFEIYRGTRDVYAVDLPGFGFSERTAREYSPEVYKQTILDLLGRIGKPADVIAFSLSSEFAANAALEHPEYFRSLTLISPVGFNRQFSPASPGSAKQSGVSDWAHRVLAFPLWGQALYDLLTTKASIKAFLKSSFVGEVDTGLVEYDYLTAHQPGAHHAPLYFVSGKLFQPDIREAVYAKLTVPVLVIYDQDANVTFDMLPEHLSKYPNWHAVRVAPTLGLPHFEKLPDVIHALDDFFSFVRTHHAY